MAYSSHLYDEAKRIHTSSNSGLYQVLEEHMTKDERAKFLTVFRNIVTAKHTDDLLSCALDLRSMFDTISDRAASEYASKQSSYRLRDCFDLAPDWPSISRSQRTVRAAVSELA